MTSRPTGCKSCGKPDTYDPKRYSGGTFCENKGCPAYQDIPRAVCEDTINAAVRDITAVGVCPAPKSAVKKILERLLAEAEAKHKEELNAIDLEVRNKFRPLLLEQAQIIEAKHQATLARCREAIEHVGNETDEEAMKLCEVHQAFTEGCGWCQERSEMLARVVEKRHYLTAFDAALKGEERG